RGAYPRADFARRRVTVHDWHLAIHQHDVVAAPLHGLQCLLPVRDDVELASKRLEHVAGNDLVDLIVLGQQHACQNASCYRRSRRRHIGSGRDTQGLCERLNGAVAQRMPRETTCRSRISALVTLSSTTRTRLWANSLTCTNDGDEGAACSGRLNQKVEPWDSVLSKPIWPPISSTN